MIAFRVSSNPFISYLVFTDLAHSDHHYHHRCCCRCGCIGYERLKIKGTLIAVAKEQFFVLAKVGADDPPENAKIARWKPGYISG